MLGFSKMLWQTQPSQGFETWSERSSQSLVLTGIFRLIHWYICTVYHCLVTQYLRVVHILWYSKKAMKHRKNVAHLVSGTNYSPISVVVFILDHVWGVVVWISGLSVRSSMARSCRSFSPTAARFGTSLPSCQNVGEPTVCYGKWPFIIGRSW